MSRVMFLKHSKRTLVLLPILAIFARVQITQSQAAYAPISAQNVTQITQIERIGNGVPRAMAFSADGSRLAVATTLGVWMIDPSGKGTPQLFEGQNGAESIAFSPDGSMIAAGGDDNSVMIFNAASGKPIEKLTNHIYPVTTIAWSGSLIASGDWSGIVRLWDTNTWSEAHVLSTSEKVDQLIFNASGSQISAVGDDMLTTWDSASGQLLSQVASIAPTGYPVDAYHGTKQAGYNSDESQIQVWDEGKHIVALDGFYGELFDVYFTPDERVGAHPFVETYLWSVASGQSDNSPVPVISPDGSRKATFGNDGVIRLFDTKTDNLIAELHGHIRAINAVAFSPDGKLLASASNDDTIQLWDATVTQDSGSLLVLHDPNGGVSSVAFNSDGTLLASAGYDGTIRLWGIKNG